MTPRRVVWVVEKVVDGAAKPWALGFRRVRAEAEAIDYRRFDGDGCTYRVVKYVPANPKRRTPVDR